jgi:LytS/YehU family sensor histidine kinase
MKEPGILFYSLLVAACILFVLAGAYFLARFDTLFKNRIKNEVLRKNILAWLIIFCLAAALSPLTGGFFYLLKKYGWWGMLIGHSISITATTLLTYNTIRWMLEQKWVKRLSFIKEKLLVIILITVTVLMVNIPFALFIYKEQFRNYIQYNIASSIYMSVVSGLIFSLVNYLQLERKKKIDEKELELARLRELKTKAELDALHSKINPHFLYNALNSISDLSVSDGKKGRKMTIALADLFRYSINNSDNNYSTVKEETEMAEVYLQIEKIRFEDQLNYSVNIELGTEYYLIPRFLLQPLVENAVKHGLKATGKMTDIQIEIKKNGEGLMLNIADNGPLFTKDLNPGYGVKSVFDKLDLLFPGQYSVQFSNDPRKQVSILINKLLKNEPGI